MITLHLRPDAVFHDGRPVASGDVRATLETVWHGGARMPQARAALADLDGPPTHHPRVAACRGAGVRRQSELIYTARLVVDLGCSAKAY
jgi:hypothetical protein